MKEFAQRHGTRVVGAVAVALLAGAFLTSEGAFSIDEVIYRAGVDALRTHGSLVVENGYAQFGSNSLKLWLLVNGPNGLTPQYPVGSALAGASLSFLFGDRALIVLNALAAGATLFVTRSLARALFGREDVAFTSVLLLLGGTFWLEYAHGIWPHAASVLFVTLAVLCAVRALDDAAPFYWAVLSGAAVGAGFLFRTDSILILPAIGAFVLLSASRPWRVLFGGAVGLLPAVTAAAGANSLKFGSLNPLSYGRDGGGTDLTSHFAALGLIAMLCAILFFARRLPWRPGPWAISIGVVISVISVIAVIAVMLAFPSIAATARRYLGGAYALMFDSTALQDPRPGVHRTSDGTQLFWGLPKKALGQSLPWLGLLLMLATRRWDRNERPAITLILFAVAVWTAPFFILSWHGGLGSNMRYFLPVLPLLSILAAKVWSDLGELAGGSFALARRGFLAGLVLVVGWSLLGPGQVAGAHQIMSLYLCAAIGMVALLAGWGGRQGIALVYAAQFLGAAGFATAFAFMANDVTRGQVRRLAMAQANEALSAIPSPSLVLGLPEMLEFQLKRANGLAAVPYPMTDAVDASLFEQALSTGYPVFLDALLAKRLLEGAPRLALGARRFAYPGGLFVEIKLRSASAFH